MSVGVRGLLVDVDGVLHIEDTPIPGAVETLAELRRRGMPFRLLTNTTVRSRHTLASAMRGMGFDVADDEIITAGGAAAAYVRRRFPGQPVYLLARPDVAAEFDGVPLTDGPEARVVVVGDAGERFTFAAMNHAFRLLFDGAALVAMHRSPWWQTAEGPTIDMGAFVRGLEYSSGVRATMVGKPATPFFRAGFRALGLPPHEVAMVGDTVRQDVLPAMRLGATGVLVRTGMFREGDLSAGTPDVVLDSVADLLPMLDICSIEAAH
ncbi:MAG TPA: TIGR01458 family HAD-type hydrolase [Thermomicrobiales bacterium]|nr:TIGR01458 family HAD-type hydrolase [Thermomicrobiales bacterium]